MALRLLLALLGLASAFAFVPASMPMPLQHRQACVSQGPQMKALNKPARLAEVRRKYNKHHKSEMRTYIKKVHDPLPLLARAVSAQLHLPHAAGSGAAAPSCALLCVCPHAPCCADESSPTPAPAQTELACEAGDYEAAQKQLNECQSKIDKNVKRGLVHKNTAARKKSQLTLKVKKLEPGAPAPAPA
jgi:small subunit ribosomal protein S20